MNLLEKVAYIAVIGTLIVSLIGALIALFTANEMRGQTFLLMAIFCLLVAYKFE